MAKHNITYRDEMRYGMRNPEVRVVCSCGDFEEKAQTEREARIAAGKHLQGVVNKIKPQQTLDI